MFRRKIHVFVAIVIFLWITVINRFPRGYVYTSGDFAQPVDINNLFKGIFYVWGDGLNSPGEGGFASWFAAILYYAIFYLVPGTIGLDNAAVLSYILFLFLFLSYLSIFSALRLFFGEGNRYSYTVISLVYALNPTTLYFFTYTWGFSHQVSLYITLPILTASLHSYLLHPSIKKLGSYLLFLFLSIPGFTNSAFFAALLLFFFAYVVLCVFIGVYKLTRRFVLSGIVLGVSSVLVLSPWLLPTLSVMGGQLHYLVEGRFNLQSWLVMQSASLVSIFVGLPGYRDFFPFRYGFGFLIFFSFVPILLLGFLLPLCRKAKKTLQVKQAVVFAAVWITFAILLKKAFPPLAGLTLEVFNLPFMAALRSYEKIAVFMPFTLLMAICGLFFASKLPGRLFYLVLLSSQLAVLPFYTGGIQTRYSITLTPGKNYKNSQYSGLVKIPPDYYEIAKGLNADLKDTKVLAMPYSVVSSDTWNNYPAWKMLGFNPVDFLISKPTISQNSSQYLLRGWNPHLDFLRLKPDPSWYIRMLSYFSVSDLLYHLDVRPDYVFVSYPRIEELAERGLVSKKGDYESALLFSLDPKTILPKVYIPQETFMLTEGLDTLPYALLMDDPPILNQFILSGVSSAGCVSEESPRYSIVERRRTFATYDNAHWNPSWRWPTDMRAATTEAPISDTSAHLRELVYEIATVTLKSSTINKQLIEKNLKAIESAIKTAAPDYKARWLNKDVDMLLSYLVRLKETFELGSPSGVYFDYVLRTFDKWLNDYVHADCAGYCYDMVIDEAGSYDFAISKGELGGLNSKLDDIQLELKTQRKEEVLRARTVGSLVLFGPVYLEKEDSVNFTLVRFNPVPEPGSVGEAWTKDPPGDVNFPLVGNGKIQLKPVLYQPLVEWGGSERYKVHFDAASDLTNYTYVIYEDTVNDGRLSKTEMGDARFLPTPTTSDVKYVTHVDGTFMPVAGAEQIVYFTSSLNSVRGYLVLYGIDAGDRAPKNIESSLHVERVYDPKLIVRKTATAEISAVPVIRHQKINSTRYEAVVKDASAPFCLVLNESFDKNWVLRGKNGRKLPESRHYLANGYANGWVVDKPAAGFQEDYALSIEYTPQKLFYIGILIALGTGTVITGLLLWNTSRKSES